MRSMTVVQRYARRPDQILADIQAAFPGARISMLPDEQRARQRSHVRLSLGSLTIDRFETVGSEISTIAADRFHLGFVAQGKVDVSLFAWGQHPSRRPVHARDRTKNTFIHSGISDRRIAAPRGGEQVGSG